MFIIFTERHLTFKVQHVVPRKHDSAAHDVALETARAKLISNPTAVKDLPIICEANKSVKLNA